ncbi:AMP-binding protein [Bernardetia sp. OM2101]|uniref:AMP-binding protein n=1 Tax=Bernardetia sp. OM2101 TaxID=3344876 RepID=UPI0035D08877
MENICQYFLDSAQKFPNRIAIIHKSQSITFQELEQRVKETSLYFCKMGIKEGYRVLVFVPMSIDLYVNVLSLFYIGATAVFLDQFLDRKKLESCAKIANCQGFIGVWKSKLLFLLSKQIRNIPIRLEVRNGLDKLEKEIGKNWRDIYFDDRYSKNSSLTALITFTTGSTATPKAAKRTHNFLNEQFLALSEVLADNQIKSNKGFKTELTTLPIVLLLNLGIGSTSVIADFKKIEKMKPQKILSQIKKYKIDRMVGSPFFVRMLSEFIENETRKNKVNKADFDSLKEIFVGGAPVFQDDAEYFDSIFSNSSIKIVYGSTEAEPISVVSTLDFKQKKQSKGLFVGKPYHKTKVKIITITNEIIFCENEQKLDKITQPQNEIGEIIVSGLHVLEEYFFDENDKQNKEEAKQIVLKNKIFIDGVCWHRTGDSGFLDDENNLFLTGRCNSLIYKNKEGKELIYAPFYYERLLNQIDEIEIGTLILKNHKLTFIIELKTSYQKKNIQNAISQKLQNDFLDIEQIIFIKKIPKDKRHYSKIDYSKLSS